MISFKKHILTLDQAEWDYYFGFSDIQIKHPFESRRSHKQFVKSYFSRAGKGEVFDILNYLPHRKLNNARLKHTSSIFFLGVLIKNKTSLRNRVLSNVYNPGYSEFPFLWFLTCLFHDFAYTLEDEGIRTLGIQNIDDLLVQFGITNYLLSEPSINEDIFSQNIIVNYFTYRLSKNKLDHGIVAGLYLFDKLHKIRHEKYNNRKSNLNWSEELIPQYARVCHAITCHNIWLPDDETKVEYEEYGLNSLFKEYNAISADDYPLLFILGLVDTIDPIKLYQRLGFCTYEIMDNIMFDFQDNLISVTVRENSDLDIELLRKEAQTLEGWLAVNINSTGDTLNIYFL